MSAAKCESTAPRASAIFNARSVTAASWVVNVLVAATPISSPARVYSTPSASRASELPTMLLMANTRVPSVRTRRVAASVSAVSPDWDMGTASRPDSATGWRCRSSEAISASADRRAHSSTRYFPTSEACHEVPQAMKATRDNEARSRSSRPMLASSTCDFDGSIRSASVLRTASGCSKISLSMKCGKPLRSTASSLIAIGLDCRRTGRPSSRLI